MQLYVHMYTVHVGTYIRNTLNTIWRAQNVATCMECLVNNKIKNITFSKFWTILQGLSPTRIHLGSMSVTCKLKKGGYIAVFTYNYRMWLISGLLIFQCTNTMSQNSMNYVIILTTFHHAGRSQHQSWIFHMQQLRGLTKIMIITMTGVLTCLTHGWRDHLMPVGVTL